MSGTRPGGGSRMDTGGPPMKGVEVRIAEDGEILVRGELVMYGYWRNDAETARVLKQGWLHPGAVGHLDDPGRLLITERTKDFIVHHKGRHDQPSRGDGKHTLTHESFQRME